MSITQNNIELSTSSQAAPARAIRVLVADDHRITVWGLQQLVDAARPAMEVVGTASSVAELLEHDALPTTDIVVLDLDMGGHDSAPSIGEIGRRCGGRVLVLTACSDLDVHRHVVMQGARGVLHKSESAATIIKAIGKVHAGEIWLHRSLLGEVLARLTTPGSPASPEKPVSAHAARIASLTPREREIVAAMVRLAGTKQIAVAADLSMSENTLRNHLTTIYAKLKVHGRLELHLYALEHGIVHQAAPPH